MDAKNKEGWFDPNKMDQWYKENEPKIDCLSIVHSVAPIFYNIRTDIFSVPRVKRMSFRFFCHERKDGGPDCIIVDADTLETVVEEYYLDNKESDSFHSFHRENGPAIIVYDDNKVYMEQWMQDGVRHREDGPSIFVRNKPIDYNHWWHIRGVAVTEQIVMRPETLTVQQINSILNIEAKRIAIERYGWIKYLEEADAKVISENVNEIDGTKEVLVRLNIGLSGSHGSAVSSVWNGDCNLLLCSCPSTGRVYPIEVPSNILTCEVAQEWLIGQRMSGVRIIGAS